MSLENINRFLTPIPGVGKNNWLKNDLHGLASLRLPDIITNTNDVILRGDAHILWVKWFVEGLCTPYGYVSDPSKGLANVLTDVRARVNHMFQHDTAEQREIFSRQIAVRVMEEVTRQRSLKRDYAGKKTKEALIAASAKPRCWMCGYAFTQVAIDNFLKKTGAGKIILPISVDLLRPRGLIERDITIEVEHILPVAAGGIGISNLALSCGWCNSHKGAKTSIYDASFQAPKVPYKLGTDIFYELPHPFWTIRLLAIHRKCECITGCVAHAGTDEMFIAPMSPLGSPNPSNLKVFCGIHDPYKSSRFVSRAEAEKIWSERKR